MNEDNNVKSMNVENSVSVGSNSETQVPNITEPEAPANFSLNTPMSTSNNQVAYQQPIYNNHHLQTQNGNHNFQQTQMENNLPPMSQNSQSYGQQTTLNNKATYSQQPMMPNNMQQPIYQQMPLRPVEPFNLFQMIGILFSKGPTAFFYQKPAFSSRLTLYISTIICWFTYILASSFRKSTFLESIGNKTTNIIGNVLNSLTGTNSVPIEQTKIVSRFSALFFFKYLFISLIIFGLAFLFVSLSQKRGMRTAQVNFQIVSCVISSAMVFMAPLFLLSTLFYFIPFIDHHIFASSAFISFIFFVLWGIGSVLNNEEKYAFKIGMIFLPVFMLLQLF